MNAVEGDLEVDSFVLEGERDLIGYPDFPIFYFCYVN